MPSGSLQFLVPKSDLSGRGASGCRVRLKTNDTQRRPVRRFLPRDFDLSAAPALAGDFSGGPGSDLNRRTPAHPRQPDLTTMPRHTGAPGALSGPARFWAAQSPPPCPHVARGDHFPRTPGKGSRVLPLPPAPAPPRHNALWCIRGRNGASVSADRDAGEMVGGVGLNSLENSSSPSPCFLSRN